jgi:spermidine/putrescine-binding protein
VQRFRRLDLIQELDLDALGNLGNLRPEFREASFDPGNRFTVPWATGTTGIGYDATLLPEPPSYDIFLSQEFAGRMTILEEIRDAFGLALFSLGLDPNTRSAADVDAAADRLIELKGVIRGFDSTRYLEDLASGDLVVAHAYSSDLLLAKEQNPNLEFVLPEAGALRWVDLLAVPADAPHADNAHRFIDFYLQPEVSAEVMTEVQVDTGNLAALDLAEPAVLQNPVIFPPANVLGRLAFTADLGDDEKLYTDAWERVQSA